MSCYRCFHNRWGKGGRKGTFFGNMCHFFDSENSSQNWRWVICYSSESRVACLAHDRNGFIFLFFSAASFFRKCRGREGCNGGKFVLLKNDPWRIPAARTRRAIFLPFFVSSFLLSSRNDQTTERERETTEEEEEKAHCHVLWGALIATSCSFLPPLKMAPSTSPKSPPNAIRKGSSFGGILWANFGDSLHETKAGWSILSDQFTSSRS